MAEFAALHVSPHIAEVVARLGWTADDPVMRDAAATVARGHNLVALLPPVPAAATPVLAGLLSRLAGETRGMLVAAESDLDEWAGRLHVLATGSHLHLHVARRAGRAARLLRTAPGVDLLVCSPETALALHHRSALRPETLSSVVLAWPGGWGAAESLAEVMQDVPKDAQRIVVGSSGEDVSGSRRTLRASGADRECSGTGGTHCTGRACTYAERAVESPSGCAPGADRTARSGLGRHLDPRSGSCGSDQAVGDG